MEFGIGAKSHKCLNDWATRWSKKFQDRFSRFDTIPAVTDGQRDTHPANQLRRLSILSLLRRAGKNALEAPLMVD